MTNYTFLSFRLPEDLSEDQPEDIQAKLTGSLACVSAQSLLVHDKKLTKNEFYCLLLAAQGMTSVEASKILGLAKDTIESHRKKVRRKLKCKNMAHAVLKAVRYELSTTS